MVFATAILLGLAQFPAWAVAGAPATIRTSSGQVKGFTDNVTPNVAQYLGIPFAEQPVGRRRWLPPVAKKRENKVIVANNLGPSCPQFEGDKPNVWLNDAPEYIITPRLYQSEECLKLNIWAPLDRCEGRKDKKDLLPVLVWIHGGGFVTGGPTVPYQVPARWVERTGEHIVVGINYRLNIFGFPNSKDLKADEQNLGFLDQRLALEWIRDNIRNFGGDPARITLWGQSAGAASVDNYNFAYPNDPIVSGLIMNSGTSLLPLVSQDAQHTSFTYVAQHFGCNDTRASAEIDCLRGVDSVSIEKFLKQHADSGATPGLSFVPVYDNRTFFSDVTARALAGKFSRKPAIIGTTKDEGTAFPAYNKTYGPPKSQADAATATYFLCPAAQTTQNRYSANTTTFRYHSSDLPLYFGTYGIARGNGTDFQRQVSEKVQDYYLAFAKDPVRGLPKMGWEAYEPSGDAVLIAYEGSVVQGIKESALEAPCNGTQYNGKPLPP